MNKILYDYIISRAHRALRRPFPTERVHEFRDGNLSYRARMSHRFCIAASLEEPTILPEQKIVFMRTLGRLPDVLTEDEWAEIKKTHFVHELGYISNLAPDYASVIAQGLDALIVSDKTDECTKESLRAVLDLAARYRECAEEQGRADIAAVLSRVPAKSARDLREALQFLRILHYALWLEGNYHNTLGCFDRYMRPYFDNDIASGALTLDEAYELISEFFLSCNIDSDLYVGVQQGDNGQSLMLGGATADGGDAFCTLSELCLKASAELKMIDPKINLRVSSKTPLEVYEKGSELTAVGLGFPQYSNDDIILPGLAALGYDHADAVNYSCAACWEFIVPGCGADIANIGALSYAKAVDRAVRASLDKCQSMEDFWQCVEAEINSEVDSLCSGIDNIFFLPSPIMDTMVHDGNAAEGGKYNNFGLHGTGIGCATDSLAAIEEYIYNRKLRTPAELIAALDNDFENDTELLAVLRQSAPKLGFDDERADKWAVKLVAAFADSLRGRTNCRGGVWRAGTGSAMYYLWHANELSASPDGRRRGEGLGTNYSPSLFAKISDPVALVNSFCKPKLEDAVNGGPLTLEFQRSMFDSPDSITKTAQLVKYFISRGGHQLQLNAIDRETLLKAQADPDSYRQLIVRIWGWSAYFTELDREYQDHVLARQTYSV